MSTGIPSFINSQGLQITHTHRAHDKGESRQLTAVDPEGDSITLTSWTQANGPACIVADEKLLVNYREHGQPPAKDVEVSAEDAYPLFRAVMKAKKSDNLDDSVLGYIIADLKRVGGLGGAC